MESESSGRRGGIVGTLQALGDDVLAGIQSRIELLSLELQEEKYRLIQIFLWISAAIFSGMLALTFASLMLVYVFWESARLFVLGGLTLLYVAAFVTIVFLFRRFLARQPRPFAATIDELGKDRECIRKES